MLKNLKRKFTKNNIIKSTAKIVTGIGIGCILDGIAENCVKPTKLRTKVCIFVANMMIGSAISRATDAEIDMIVDGFTNDNKSEENIKDDNES